MAKCKFAGFFGIGFVKCYKLNFFLFIFAKYAVLDTRISVRLKYVRHAQTTPPGFCNGLDWRALVNSHIPTIVKLREAFTNNAA